MVNIGLYEDLYEVEGEELRDVLVLREV